MIVAKDDGGVKTPLQPLGCVEEQPVWRQGTRLGLPLETGKRERLDRVEVRIALDGRRRPRAEQKRQPSVGQGPTQRVKRRSQKEDVAQVVGANQEDRVRHTAGTRPGVGCARPPQQVEPKGPRQILPPAHG
jgi:hypothetical protein